MNKKIITVVVIVLLLGGGYWVVQKNKDDNKTNNSQTSSSGTSTSSGFDALPTTGASYVATISSTANGKTISSTMEYDKNSGAVKYTAGKSTLIYTKDAYYICQTQDKCYKYSLSGNNSSGFDPKAYEYSADKLSGLRSGAVDGGTQPCPAGTCHVWKVTAGGYTSSVFIDTATKRISQVEGSTSSGSSKVVYEYKDVTVTVPANAQSLPNSYPSGSSSGSSPY